MAESPLLRFRTIGIRPKNITGTGIRPKNITGTGIRPNKSVPRHCLRRYRLNVEVQGELLWFLICFLNETMLVFNL
jgi:hypothetical protein